MILLLSGLIVYQTAYVSYSGTLVIMNFTCGLIVDTCGDPGVPANGNTIGTSFSVGSVVMHTCDSGFVLMGATERECLPDGRWSEPLPSCIGNL